MQLTIDLSEISRQIRMSTLKDFTILQKLGEGAFGIVYRVRRGVDSLEYALKKVKIASMKEKERENAVNEVRILASLSDQFVIGYKQAFYDEPSQSLCVVMELATGGDILKRVEEHKRNRTKFSENEIWKALTNMAKGLQSLHSNNILHRDLKCANVFVTKEGNYKLGDLNVSKVLKSKLAHTQTGTPYYASPQVWRDQPYDGRSDIWSLGCVIYEMAALKPPFQASDLQGLYKKVQRGYFDRIPQVYSSDLQNVIGMCLKVSPSGRPTAEALLNNSTVVKYVGAVQQQSKPKPKLLQTIKFSGRDLKSLQNKLPKANYDSAKHPEEKSHRVLSSQKELSSARQRVFSACLNKDSKPLVLPERQKKAPLLVPSGSKPVLNSPSCKPPMPAPSSINRSGTSSQKPQDPLQAIIKQYQRIKQNRQQKDRGCRKQAAGALLRVPSRERYDQPDSIDRLKRNNSRELLQRDYSRGVIPGLRRDSSRGSVNRSGSRDRIGSKDKSKDRNISLQEQKYVPPNKGMCRQNSRQYLKQILNKIPSGAIRPNSKQNVGVNGGRNRLGSAGRQISGGR